MAGKTVPSPTRNTPSPHFLLQPLPRVRPLVTFHSLSSSALPAVLVRPPATDMDAPDNLSSSRRRQLQGPRPPRLTIRKDSHKIEKPAAFVTPLMHHDWQQATALPLHQHHPRAIIYNASPKTHHAQRLHGARPVVQRLTGQGAAAAPASSVDPKGPSVVVAPPGFAAAFTPDSRLASIQSAARPLPLPPPYYGADESFVAGVVSRAPGRQGILSPATLPPAASSGQFSLLPFNATHLTWLTEMFPFLRSAGTRLAEEGLGAPFVLDKEQHIQPLAASATATAPPRPASFSSSSGSRITFSGGRDRAAPGKKTHLLDKVFTPADVYTKRSRRRFGKRAPMSSPNNWELGLGDACSAASSTRRLSKQLVRVRNTISPASGAWVSFAWLASIKSLAAEADDCLRDLHYRMMLAILGFGNPSKWTKTTSSPFFQSASPAELTVVSVAAKLEGLKHGRPELSVAATGNSRKLISVNHLILRCILLCRAILGILSSSRGRAGAEARESETRQVPVVFASDDLVFAASHREKQVSTTMDYSQKIPANPVYLMPSFIRSLLYLDLSNCSSLAQVPPSLCTLHNLAALNLSRCHSLQTLPTTLGMLQNLEILVLSNCQKLQNLPMSLCELSKLRLLDLSGCSGLETLPYSFVTLRRVEFLNLSDCRRLKELPQPFGILQELKYLNLSGCHGLDLDVECKFANLMCATLSPHSNIHGSDSFRDLANHLDMSRWWKKRRVHHRCNTKASAFHTYKCYEQSIIETLLSVGSDEGDATSDHTVTSICVVGESGMGKTDLVHRIYNDQLILDTFDLRIWLFTCDKKRLLGDIVKFTTRSYCYDSPMCILEEILIEELTGKKILLVLDDCDKESPDLWNDLWKLFNVCSKGSAIIVTTKSKEVANHFGAIQTCHLNSLSKEDCFMIFQEHVLGGLDKNDHPLLESIGWKAVEKCGGNALCIKALCGLLCHSEIGLSEMDMHVDGGILPALRLCYNLLPPHLQKCFKFCSLFPKGYNFIKHQIVRLWIAQGFIFPEEGSQLEETGQHYFDELFCRSFFQHSPYHNGKEHKFVMHELFHDLAHSVSENECFRSEEPFCSLTENISHLSLVPSDYKTFALTKGTRNLQSLLVVRRFFSIIRILHLDEVYVKYVFLRALNLSGTDILQLPSSIRNMKHLRFLALSNTKIKGLPFEIGQVDTLQTLELKDCCHLTDLPESTCNLVKLRHLDIRKEPGNTKVGLPRGIGKLTDLQTLTEFNIGNNLLHCSIPELKNLNGLTGHVHVTGLENIKTADDAREANIVGKKFLEALALEWFYSDEGMNDDLGKEIANEILQNLQPNSNIMELVIRNYAGNLFPLWMQEPYLIKLVSITLDNCYDCSELPYLGDLPSLKSLFIQRMNSVEKIGIGSKSLATAEKHPPRFPSLEVLTLWEMYDLEYWVGTTDGDFPRLHHLSISRCPKLINLPPLPSLVHLTVHCDGQVPSFSELPSLESLKIEGFHKIRSITFPHQLKMLKKLEISDCKELSSLFAYSLSVSDLRVVRCPKLDLVGSSVEDHHRQKVDRGRNRPTRRSMVLKTEAHANIHHDGRQWLKYGEKNIVGSKFPRSYYGCIQRNSTGCIAVKILQPNDTDGANALSVMYIYEHKHEFPINEPYLQLSSEHGTTRKRKEPDVSDDENTTKRQANM